MARGYFRFRLLLEDGADADPPLFSTSEPNWQVGDQVVAAGNRFFEIVEVRPSMEDGGRVDGDFVVRPLNPAKTTAPLSRLGRGHRYVVFMRLRTDTGSMLTGAGPLEFATPVKVDDVVELDDHGSRGLVTDVDDASRPPSFTYEQLPDPTDE